MADSRPFVSILIPCRNERAWIGRCLDSILANDYPADRREILVIDGMSDDETREVVEAYVRRDDSIRLLINPGRIVPTGLNLGLDAARGDVIMRMDAHADYPSNYVSTLIEWQRRTGADNVGAAWVTLPADESLMARSIARALSHPFGVGNARFRLGVREPVQVDTVPFGCYRREVFQRIGRFDEQLVRNQDDEFNFRLIRAGGSVVLVPGIVSYYRARRSLAQLAQAYYQYGLFKPLVAYKLTGVATLRQLAPPILVLGLGLGALAAPFLTIARVGLVALLAIYLMVDLTVAIAAAWREGLLCAPALLLVFPVLHLSYGAGFLTGCVRLLTQRRRPVRDPAGFPLSRW